MNRRPLVRRARRRLFPLQFEAMESRLLLATFLVSNTNDSGSGSLRQAIASANMTAGFNYIVFGINSTGMPVITPASPLPEIKNPVFIDGLSQLGSGLVEISGAVPARERTVYRSPREAPWWRVSPSSSSAARESG